jgi:hypothetical protein
LERRAQAVRIREYDRSRQQRHREASLSIRGWRGGCGGSRLRGTRTSPSHVVKLWTYSERAHGVVGPRHSSGVPFESPVSCLKCSVEE